MKPARRSALRPHPRPRPRPARRLAALTAATLAVPALAGSGLLLGPETARADQTTVSHDLLRTGWDKNEAALSPAAVSASDFGPVFDTTVDGNVYGQPLVSGDSLLVTTEKAKVYALDKNNGTVKWSKSFGAPFQAASVNCGDISPDLGSTSTPVIDPATQTVYLTTKIADGPDAEHPSWYLHALSLSNGSERTGWPVKIQGAPSNDPNRPFNAFTQNQRPGLLLMDGGVFLGFGSHCITTPFTGYVVRVSTTAAAITDMWTTQAGTGVDGGGIWQGGGAIMSDGAGRIFVTTGNALSPAPAASSKPPSNLGESVVRLSVDGNGKLKAEDFFSPSDASTLNLFDGDLGSGGPVGLPDSFGTTTVPHLMVQTGKDGRVFLLNRDRLGGSQQGAGGGDDVVGVTGPYRGQWGHPAVWGGDGGYVYMTTTESPLRAFKRGVDASGKPTLTAAGTSAGTFGFGSGSPVVTSSGSTSGSALVWVVYAAGSDGKNAELRAYDVVPTGGVLKLRYSAAIGVASKFSTPATDNGKVYVGTRDGHVRAFGRPANVALTAPTVTFPAVAVGATASATARLTANQLLTVSAVSAAAPFTATPPALPATLLPGQSIDVPLKYTPTAAGERSGTLAITTNAGSFAADLRGTGTAPGLTPSPGSLDFGSVPANRTTKTLSVDLTNYGTAAETISSLTLPSAPFAVTSAPAVGTVVQPGASLTLPVAFTPTDGTAATGSVTVASTNGTTKLALTGTGLIGDAKLEVTPTTDFGAVTVGRSATSHFTATNSGKIPLILTVAKPPAGVFSAPDPLDEGLALNPGESIDVPVVFTPTAPGAVTARYEVVSDDGRGSQFATFTGTGVAAVPVVPAPSAGGWKLNGSAALTGSDLVLTPASSFKAGSAVWPTALATEGLDVQFRTSVTGGTKTPGDGLTFALLDPAKNKSTALAGNGSALGFAGLTGVAVSLDSVKNAGEPANGFVGVARSNGWFGGIVNNQATANATVTGAHTVRITVRGGVLTVFLDGTQVLTRTTTLTPTALLAFTASTGGQTSVHSIGDVVITRP